MLTSSHTSPTGGFKQDCQPEPERNCDRWIAQRLLAWHAERDARASEQVEDRDRKRNDGRGRRVM
ncbi:MAG: hypothetical protein ACRDZO_18875 [Egibacteraceae bacterium]